MRDPKGSEGSEAVKAVRTESPNYMMILTAYPAKLGHGNDLADLVSLPFLEAHKTKLVSSQNYAVLPAE